MKKYIYKGRGYTLYELERLPDCKVAGHELRRNLWRKKLPVEEALVSPIKLMRNKARRTYFFNGLELTIAELSELPECKVSYYRLSDRLRSGVSVRFAMGGEDLPDELGNVEVDENIKRKEIDLNQKAQGGQISFNTIPHRLDKSYTYEWLVAERLGFVMDESGINIEKSVDKMIN